MQDQLNTVAHFLESRGQHEKALEIATESDYRFELAVHLQRLDLALDIAEGSESEAKWRQLGELALSSGKLDVSSSVQSCSSSQDTRTKIELYLLSEQYVHFREGRWIECLFWESLLPFSVGESITPTFSQLHTTYTCTSKLPYVILIQDTSHHLSRFWLMVESWEIGNLGKQIWLHR